MHQTLFREIKAGNIAKDIIEQIEQKEKHINMLVSEMPEAIFDSLDGIERITEIVKAIKCFSHPDQKEKCRIDINKMIRITTTLAKNEWKYVADLKTDFDLNIPLFECYGGELSQVILNIIVNASHAIEESLESGGKGAINIKTTKNENDIEIRISDTGPGIPEEIQKKIFSPFFTTKAVGKGTGQGLAIAHRIIVERHGGNISLKTKKGEGTVFIITLPLQQEP